MKNLILLLLICVLSINIHALDTSTYKSGIIYQDGKFLRLDGKRLKHREIRNEINTVPAAAAFNKKAKTQEIIGVASSFAGLACLFLNNRKVGQYPYRKDNGLTIPTVVFYGTGLYFYFRSVSLRKKASNEYFKHHKITY